jgi:uncharacterized Tic20 family protein
MDAPKPVDSPSMQAHKRQLAWQILVPFLVVTVLILVVAGLIVAGAATSNQTFADVSTIWLIAPTLVVALLFIVVLCGLVYGITRLLQVTPRYTGMAQDFFVLISTWTRTIADGAAKPFVWFQQAGAILKSIFK